MTGPFKEVININICWLGKPKGYPVAKVPELGRFGLSLKSIGIDLRIERGNHYRTEDGSLGKANVDAQIIAFLTSNVMITYLVNKASKGRYKEPVIRTILTQYEKYMSNPPIQIILFTGDADFLPVAQQIRSYSEDEIKVYFASHPCIANGIVQNKYFIDLKEVLSSNSYTPPWESRGTILALMDGNNYLNSLAIADLMTNREDFPTAFRLTKDIFTKLNLIPLKNGE